MFAFDIAVKRYQICINCLYVACQQTASTRE